MNRDQCNTCQYDYQCTIQEKLNFKYDEIPCEEYVGPTNNSKGMFNRLFTYKGRIRRLEFGLSYLFYNLIVIAIAYSPDFIALSPELLVGGYIQLAFLTLCFLVILMCLQSIKRCHDLGKSGWWIFMPIYNPFFLLFAEGDDFINEYGTNPKESYESQVFHAKK